MLASRGRARAHCVATNYPQQPTGRRLVETKRLKLKYMVTVVELPRWDYNNNKLVSLSILAIFSVLSQLSRHSLSLFNK